MATDHDAGTTAVQLMRLALPLLDRAGEACAAARLQQAIDTVERAAVQEPTEDELDRWLDTADAYDASRSPDR